jgi:hypothetical protein
VKKRLAVIAAIIAAVAGAFALGRYTAPGSGLDPTTAACLSTSGSLDGSTPAYADNNESLAQCIEDGGPLVP